jgi:hypothetical protein
MIIITMCISYYALCCFFFNVEIPKGKYNGQKLKKLVIIKIDAKIKRTIANVPEIRFVKKAIAIMKATSILAALSIVPMFGFISLNFLVNIYGANIRHYKTVYSYFCYIMVILFLPN